MEVLLFLSRSSSGVYARNKDESETVMAKASAGENGEVIIPSSNGINSIAHEPCSLVIGGEDSVIFNNPIIKRYNVLYYNTNKFIIPPIFRKYLPFRRKTTPSAYLHAYFPAWIAVFASFSKNFILKILRHILQALRAVPAAFIIYLTFEGGYLMLGAITGDIIGSVYEENNVRRTDFQLFREDSHITDDSVLTIAQADCLLSGAQLKSKLLEYYYLYPDALYGNTFMQWLQSGADGAIASHTNGAAMRVSPVAWAYKDLSTVLLKAEESAVTTHAHPEAVRGA